MLVVSRKAGESIILRDDIEVVVVEIRGNKVRLGVTAPQDVSVHRKEVFEAISKGSRSDGSTTTSDQDRI